MIKKRNIQIAQLLERIDSQQETIKLLQKKRETESDQSQLTEIGVLQMKIYRF